ncbi:hypothetical protein ES705_35617 [subsurface metagenome]
MALEEAELGPGDLEKLRQALAGLDIYHLALVLDFAQYLLRLQASIEAIEKVKQN